MRSFRLWTDDDFVSYSDTCKVMRAEHEMVYKKGSANMEKNRIENYKKRKNMVANRQFM